MGKIIVKNIKGMGWKAKITLIAMFTLAFSVLLYQGWYKPKQTLAAVANINQWNATAVANGTGNPSTAAAYSYAAGSNRLLLVAVEYETDATGAHTVAVTYGGTGLTQILNNVTQRQCIWIGYMKEANLPASGSNIVSTITLAGGAALTRQTVHAAVYANVDQGTPVVASNSQSSSSAQSRTNTAINVENGGYFFYIWNFNTTTSGASTSNNGTGYTEHYDQLYTTYSLSAASKPITANGTESVTVTTSLAASRCALSVVSLKPATTTLATGTDPAAATIAPGAAVSDANTFTFQTGSAGTIETITSITVNLSTNVGIARLAITDNANTELGFTTAPVTGSNTIAVSGLTATNTLTTYKVRITPLSHAAMPAVPGAEYAVTAPVTAWAGNNMHAGTDTDTAALTIDNLSPANPSGVSGTAGDNQVKLDWTNPGADFSQVIVLRNTATITDTPVEGAAYTSTSTIGTSAVRYVGNAATFTDTTAVNGTAYYYRIFAKDVNGNYSQTGVEIGPYTPVSPDVTAPAVDAGFAATTPVNTLDIPVTAFSATDEAGGSGVAGYLITTSATVPGAGDAGWTAAPPATYRVSGEGSYTLYPWAKDGAPNVSAVYGSPVTVVVDTTKPTVSAFTLTYAQSNYVKTRAIPVASFTANDPASGGVSSGVAGYMITTSNTPPAVGAAGWTAAAPATYTVGADGSYTLYPWIKDAAGNVSVAFGTPRDVIVDSTAPAVPANVSPADNAVDQPTAVTLESTTVSDGTGIGGVEYTFHIENTDLAFTQDSAWQTGFTYAPTGLQQGYNYIWKVKSRDALGNESVYSTPFNFTTLAPCSPNNPTLSLLTASGGTASTITTNEGTAIYKLKVTNNDFGSCGSSDFNLTVSDSNVDGSFDVPSLLGTSAVPITVTLNPGANTTIDVAVKAHLDKYAGYNRTFVTSTADTAKSHAAVESGKVNTTLNVVGCTANTPLLILGPDAAYVNRGGTQVYTVTVKNTDTGTGCSPVAFNLAHTDSNSADFNASTLGAASVSLNAGQQGSVKLTVSAKSTAVKGNVNVTTVSLTATGHTSPANKTATSTVGNPMLHNSDNTVSTKWSADGGWGIPGKRYGEIICTTCHADGYQETVNIKRVREMITTPDAARGAFPGDGKQIIYNRMASPNELQGSLGFDSTATPRTSSSKICEVCHTYDATKANGVIAHPYATTATLGNHYGTDGVKDCVVCHKHNKGFGASGMACNACHGDSTVTATIDASNRYVVAPPVNASGGAGVITGTGQVSNDKKVGAHQTHLRLLNGFSNYSTVDFRCESCHGPVPTDFAHANGSSAPAFQGLATKGGMTPTWASATLTCSNTYCHNPAASGILKKTTNAGSNIFPSWTGAKYLGDTRKTQANCGVCHKSPGDAGFEPAGTHANMTIDATACIGCHGHEGDNQGAEGKRHMDGKLYGAGACNTCHGYLAASWATAPVINAGGAGAHAKHVTYLTTKLYTVTLNPDTDKYADTAAAAWTNVCGVCHDNVSAKHLDNTVDVKFKTDYFFGTTGTSTYSGTPGGTGNKTCSNLSCHYFTTPLWSN